MSLEIYKNQIHGIKPFKFKAKNRQELAQKILPYLFTYNYSWPRGLQELRHLNRLFFEVNKDGIIKPVSQIKYSTSDLDEHEFSF
jgi:hypothetical protein